MVALSGKDQTLAIPANSLIDYDGRSHSKESPKVSGYEQFREERIKANLERMQQLGIVDLSLKLKSIKPHGTSTLAIANLSAVPLHCCFPDPLAVLPGALFMGF
ncbi:unnamed protein product [Thlaspi arvense]|uniref:Uncharacterized protein n=1 Tax=Thlaspi arvense TaxID=13288 RepID=A0AAU9RXJ2_THLAR|nr:unnamed protein product [Thlaspi arvense]